MITEEECTKRAYDIGYQAAQNGSGVGVNPYHSEDELPYSEMWLNGWSDGIKGNHEAGC